MELALERKLGSKQAEEIMEKIIKEGSDYMLAIEQMVVDENRRIRAEGRRTGIVEGKRIGRVEGILQIARKMLENGIKDEEIIKYTNISKKEIEEMRKNNKRK